MAAGDSRLVQGEAAHGVAAAARPPRQPGRCMLLLLPPRSRLLPLPATTAAATATSHACDTACRDASAVGQ